MKDAYVLLDLELFVRTALSQNKQYIRYYELYKYQEPSVLNLTMYIETYAGYEDDIEDFIQSIIDYSCHHVAYNLLSTMMIHCIYDNVEDEKHIIVDYNDKLRSVIVETERPHHTYKVQLPFERPEL